MTSDSRRVIRRDRQAMIEPGEAARTPLEEDLWLPF
jgi:hypothetical protein